MEREQLKKDLENLSGSQRLATLEQVKKLFLRGNYLRDSYLTANDTTKRLIASEALWNVSVRKGNAEEVRYRSPYAILAKAPKNGDIEKMLEWRNWYTRMA